MSYNIAYYVEFERKMTQMNLFIKQKQTHRHRKQTYGYPRGKSSQRDKLGVWELTYTQHSSICKTDKQQGSTV